MRPAQHGVGDLRRQHIANGTARQFLCDDPSDEKRWPDAWCERCEEVIADQGEAWDAETVEFTHIQIFCHHCYERRRRTHRRPPPDVPGDDPLLRFSYTCGTCDQAHRGLPAWAADAPAYWHGADDLARQRGTLTSDTCIIDGHYFVRACLEIPIIGSHEWWSWADPAGKILSRCFMLVAHVDRQTSRASDWPPDRMALFFEETGHEGIALAAAG